MTKIQIEPCCEYTNYSHRYKRVRDIVDGEYALKAHDLSVMGSTSTFVNSPNVNGMSFSYLRYINPTDLSAYNRTRNIGFINGARLLNATARTLSGLMGMMFRVDPVEPKLSASMEYLIDNVDGAGLSLDQQAQSTVWNVLQVGRHGLLADMPRNADGKIITRKDVNEGFRASIQEYTAENIYDWEETIVGGVKVLTLLVLHETTSEFADSLRIRREKRSQIKVYRLTDNAVTVQIFTEDKEAGFIESAELPIMSGGGRALNRIPFRFPGSMNNTPDIDPLPLEPLADVNLGHYQESANLRSSSYQLSAAQPVIADDKFQRATENPRDGNKTLDMGEESTIILGTGGSFGFYSPDPNNISSDLMEKDEARMISVGGQLISNSGQAETAEAARIKRASEMSVLESVSVNVSKAYTDLIEICYELMNVNYDDAEYSLNRDFLDSNLTPQDIDSLVRTWQAGAISKPVLDAKLQSGKVIGSEVDLEEMNELIALEDPGPDLGPIVESSRPEAENDAGI